MRASLLHPSHKYFGLSVPGVPDSLAPLNAVVAKIGKTPNTVAFYQDWTRPFNSSGATALCGSGIVPALTWESWSWNDVVDGSPAKSQPSYAPRRIAAGAYDSYIRAEAQQIKAVKCPVMLRLDQEPNGSWYPWGEATAGMHNAPAQYVAMWRHVWTIFQQAGVRNVLWTWSPNFLFPGGHDNVKAFYPGNRCVDIVGIDGYLRFKADKPTTLFAMTLASLATFVSHKPWIIAETGATTAYSQAAKIAGLLAVVAASPQLIGFTYLDENTGGANWTLTATPASTRAFRRAIGRAVFGSARATRL